MKFTKRFSIMKLVGTAGVVALLAVVAVAQRAEGQDLVFNTNIVERHDSPAPSDRLVSNTSITPAVGRPDPSAHPNAEPVGLVLAFSGVDIDRAERAPASNSEATYRERGAHSDRFGNDLVRDASGHIDRPERSPASNSESSNGGMATYGERGEQRDPPAYPDRMANGTVAAAAGFATDGVRGALAGRIAGSINAGGGGSNHPEHGADHADHGGGGGHAEHDGGGGPAEHGGGHAEHGGGREGGGNAHGRD